MTGLRDQLVAEAFLYDDPEAFIAGVDRVLALRDIEETLEEPHQTSETTSMAWAAW